MAENKKIKRIKLSDTIYDLSVDSVDAEQVKFSTDLQLTKAFGKFTPDSTGSVVIPTNTDNMSLKDLLLEAFSEELNPTTTQPNLTITAAKMKSYEVGTSVAVDFTLNTSTGSYTYGPATGVTWTDYSASLNGETIDANTGTFSSITVGDSTNLTISASAKYSDGAIPRTNLGNDFIPDTVTSTSGQIKAATDTATSGALKGYRKMFWGTLTSKPTTLDSATIRGLTGVSEQASTCTQKSLSISLNAMRVIIAVPEARTLSAVLDVNDANTNIIEAFKLWNDTTLSVEGANGYTAANYKVYYLDYANPNDTLNTYKVTIS